MVTHSSLFNHTMPKSWNVRRGSAMLQTCGIHLLRRATSVHVMIATGRDRALSSQVNRNESQPCRNAAGIQMINRRIWRELFPSAKQGDVAETTPLEVKERIQEHLSQFDLWDMDVPSHKQCGTDHLKMPPLQGKTLHEHFENIGKQHSEPYASLVRSFSHTALPPMPDIFEFAPGWTRYNADGSIEAVPCPQEDVFVFDVEVCVPEGHYPTMAAAVSDTAWYTWVARRLVESDNEEHFERWKGRGMLMESVPGTEELIPLEDPKDRGTAKKIAIGHNVSYDRQRVLEQYNLRQSGTRFLDTLSLHMATSGLSTQQVGTWGHRRASTDKAPSGVPPPTGKMMKGKPGVGNPRVGVGAGAVSGDVPEGLAMSVDPDEQAADLSWVQQSAPPSLANCYKLWCGGVVSKDDRNTFVKGSIVEIRENFQKLMKYCATDCAVTHEVFCKLHTHYVNMYPSSVSFAGLLQVGMPYLPTDARWYNYLMRSQYAFDEISWEIEEVLPSLADEVVDMVLDGRWQWDPWLRNFDWGFDPLPITSGRRKKDGTYAIGCYPRIGKGSENALLPQWYIKLFPGALADENYDMDARVIPLSAVQLPYLLRMYWTDPDWEGPGDAPMYPLHFDDDLKWGYLVPHLDVPDHEGNGPYEWESADDLYHTTHSFFKLPCLGGVDASCGSPFTKEYIRYVDSGHLRSPMHYFRAIYEINEVGGYWNSNRQRIYNQFVIRERYLDCMGVSVRSMEPKEDFAEDAQQSIHPRARRPSRVSLADLNASPEVCVLLPCVIPMGTVTRRAVERTWLTAANPSATKIGTELKSRITAPPGHKFVGADVDSQELWIAAVMGDAQLAGVHGSTALGWMTLQGSKADATDMHSKTASILDITRDEAKIVNYARIYGAAEQFAGRLLTEFDPDVSPRQAAAAAKELYSKTKGRSVRRNGVKVWEGGSESATFNRLEQIARLPAPRTPVLGAEISSSLQPRYFGQMRDQFLRSRVNWAVQSSAVDYLHLLLVSMLYLSEQYDIKTRYCISIHDEVRFIVADEDVHRAALALHISNMWTRAFFSERLESALNSQYLSVSLIVNNGIGIMDLPECIAFFSGVDIDRVLRKEVFLDCITPSNPLPAGMGQTLDVHQCGELVNWTLEKTTDNSDMV